MTKPSAPNNLESAPTLASAGEVQALLSLAWSCRSTDLERTEEISHAAMSLARDTQDGLGLARAARNLGFVALRRSEYSHAERLLNQGLGLARTLNDAALEADCLCYLAMVRSSDGEYVEALKLQLEALSIRERIGDVIGQGQSLGNLGVIHGYLGDFAASLEHHTRALERRERSGDENGRALTLNNIGVAYFEMNDPEMALEYHTRALEAAVNLSDAQVELYARVNRGGDLAALGRHAEAMREHTSALELARQLGDVESEIEALGHLGRTQLKQGESPEALETHGAALNLARGIRNPALEYRCLADIGRVHLESGALEAAVVELRLALRIAERVGLKRDVFRTHETLAEALEGLEDHASALHHYRLFYAVEREVQGERAEARARTLAIQFETDRVRQEAAFERRRNDDLARVNAALVDADRQKSELMTQLTHQARHDALTGLPNRALFNDRLERAVTTAARYGRELAVMFVDLDGFKLVNDTLGHHAGDGLLIEVARRLERAVRESDTVARMGGDEFTVILSELQDAPDAARVAQRLVNAIEAPLVISGQEVGVTASVGVSLYPADGNSAELLARHADMALYRAKQEGKNTVRFFAPEMNAEALERVKLESALRGALERQEFSVHYQPLMTADGRTRSFEALLRWRHETLGVVTPDRFIPAAEDAGLIVPIGAWVLDEALRQIAIWRAEGFADLCVAVNVSPVQLARDDFVRTVAEALQRHGLDGSSLELEVTERSIVRDFERTSSRLEALRSLGVSVSVDDFGAGQSSLAYLLRLPVDVLKVDRSFIAAMHTPGSEARVVPAMVALAHALGLSVVAEGVETPAQLDALSQLGCERLQGYLLGRPVPAGDVRRWLEDASTED